ncbi:hypothetical protein MRX96_011461 [Rhipicephalus microplus]
MNMAASSSAGESAVPCDDFMAFQEVLRKFRRVDDTIIYSLNTGFANRVICRRVRPLRAVPKVVQRAVETLTFSGTRLLRDACSSRKTSWTIFKSYARQKVTTRPH